MGLVRSSILQHWEEPPNNHDRETYLGCGNNDLQATRSPGVELVADRNRTLNRRRVNRAGQSSLKPATWYTGALYFLPIWLFPRRAAWLPYSTSSHVSGNTWWAPTGGALPHSSTLPLYRRPRNENNTMCEHGQNKNQAANMSVLGLSTTRETTALSPKQRTCTIYPVGGKTNKHVQTGTTGIRYCCFPQTD